MPEKLGPFIQPKISESNFKKNKEMQGLVSETAGPQVPPGKPGRPAGPCAPVSPLGPTSP